MDHTIGRLWILLRVLLFMLKVLLFVLRFFNGFIRGVLLQRSIVWIPLEKMTLDLLYRLHPDLEYRDIRSPYCSTCLLQRLAAKVGATYEGGATTCLLYACRGGLPRPGPLQGAAARRAATRKGRPPEGTTGCDQLARANRQQSARKGLPPAANPAARGQPCRQ
ncbi:hypothetical protein BHE74_00047929 [Ensete ventricosum]|nr:hypothetical protein BHE74_00047929 [Ensete ventricosum]